MTTSRPLTTSSHSFNKDLGRTPMAPHRQPQRAPNYWRLQEALLALLPIAVIIILFGLANLSRLGVHENYFVTGNTFFWTRQIWLLVTAVIGMCAMLHTPLPWRAVARLGWHLDRPVVTAAVLLGLVVGLLSPTLPHQGHAAAIAWMSAVHVAAEVLFFQGLITQIMWRHVLDQRVAIVVSGMVYGLYRLTFDNYWHHMDLLAKSHWVAGPILLIGIPAAWMYTRTRSILHPLIFQAVIQVCMLAAALQH